MIFEYYKNRIEQHRGHSTEDEWWFSNICSDALAEKTPSEAFESIGELVRFTLLEEDAGMVITHPFNEELYHPGNGQMVAHQPIQSRFNAGLH